MAENNQKQEPATALEEVNQDNRELQDKVTMGQKYIMWGMIALSVIAIVVLVYIFAIRNPGIKSANEAVSQADVTLSQGNDSLALAQYQQVANQYGYEGGNRAALWPQLSFTRTESMKKPSRSLRTSLHRRLS